MKSLFLTFALLSGSIAVHAGQCPTPGEVLNREFTQIVGEAVQQKFAREGSAAVSANDVLRGKLSTKTYKRYNVTYCKEEQESYNEEVCQSIPLEAALGKGNNTFRSFYDLSLSPLKRAQSFSNQVAYLKDRPAAERLEFGRQIVVYLTKQASVSGIPSSWTKFSEAISKAVTDGEIPQSIADEILVVNKDANIEALGFKGMNGVKISEATGNGTLPKFFNLNTPVAVRSTLIFTTLEGISEATATNLSGSFISFAATNGIPENWDQFVLMMKSSLESKVITPEELTLVIETNEEINRKNLGFDQSATLCKTERRTRNVNVIAKKNEDEFYQNIDKNFEVNLVGIELLPDEKEEYQVQFDGVNDLKFIYSSYYNKYVVNKYAAENDTIKMIVSGSRQQVNVPNTITAKITQAGKLFNISLQNKAYNPKIGGKVIVRVEYFEAIRFWPDYRLGTQTYELMDGSATTINPKISLQNAGHTVKIRVYVQITGSKYYNNDFSGYLEFSN